MSTKTDMAYGRQGGRFLPDGYQPVNLRGPACEVCGRPMILGQHRRHAVCSPPAACCGIPVDMIRNLDRHMKAHQDLAP